MKEQTSPMKMNHSTIARRLRRNQFLFLLLTLWVLCAVNAYAQSATATLSGTVTEASLLNESPSVSTVVDRQFAENLPLNGRSFQSLIALTPGAVATRTGSSAGGQFSINGQRPNANYFTVDGVSANIGISTQNRFGQAAAGSLPGLSVSGGTNSLVSVEALQEFKIQTSAYAPEFGRQAGGQIQIATRSGGNEFSGSVFNYFRNEAFDANDFFSNRAGLQRPATRQNDFGGVIGGPVFFPAFGEGGSPIYNGRDRTFFFFSHEGLRLSQPQSALLVVPTVAVRNAAPVNVRPFLNAYPLPNGRQLSATLAEYSAAARRLLTARFFRRLRADKRLP
jgi:hypothetical protein